MLVSSKDIKRRQATREHYSRKEGKQQDGKLLPCIFWLLCCTPELDNYTPKSTQLLFSFLFHGHIKLQIPSLHTERAATRGTVEQETVGGFSVIQKTSVKDYHPDMTAKPAVKHLHFVDCPSCFPGGWGSVSTFWLLMQISPAGTYNRSPASCPEPGHESTNRNYFFFHDYTNKKLWKKIIWNHLKMATHCHFSYQRLLAVRVATIQYLKSSYWAQKRNSIETAGFDAAFCKTWRDVLFFVFFFFLSPKQKVDNSI